MRVMPDLTSQPMPSYAPTTLIDLLLAAFILLGVVVAVGSIVPPARPAAHRHERPRPNVIFILTDDLSWNLVGFMPHVRQMQRDGMTFTNYFVTDSLCCPSRASIFTGP